MDIDDDEHRLPRPNEINVPEISQQENPISELLSPFYEEHSNTKSTEEISQNLDHLLENISKTLENASKVGSVSSECIVYPNVDVDVEANDVSENDSVASVEKDSASRTYVIEGKNVDDLTYTCPNKVINVPEDVSNVSKISQPSFVSDISSLNSESQLRPSEKSSQNFHSKTASIDSWCSNDTLFNVEENFDDICSSNDFMDMGNDKFSDTERRSITPTNDNYKFSYNKPGSQKANDLLSCRQSMSLDNDSLMNPPVEMVMNYPANVTTNSINLEIQNFSPLVTDNINYLIDQISPVIMSSPKMFSVADTENSHLLPNSSDSNGTSFSEKSSTDIISVVQNESNDASTSIQNDNLCHNETIANINESVIESCSRKDFVSPKVDLINVHNDIITTSTPLENLNNEVTDEDTAVDSAENIIDHQFKFLDTIDHSMSKIEDGAENNEKNSPTEDCSPVACQSNQQISESDINESLILNYVNVDVDQDVNNYKNICNITDKFIEMEKNIPHDDMNFTNSKYQLNFDNDLNKKHEFSDVQNLPQSLSDKSSDISKNLNQNINSNSDNSDFGLTSTSYDDFLRSIEGKDQDLTNFENSLDYKKNRSYEDVKNVSNKYYDEYGSTLSEYMAHSGLNMEPFNHTPENVELYQDQNNSNVNLLQPNLTNPEGKSYNDGISNDSSLINNRLSYIHFSGKI